MTAVQGGRTPKVLHVSPEAVPFSKVGGLGDVAGSLPAALRDSGTDCRLLTPAWEGVLDRARELGFSLSRLSRKAEAVIRW
ncbi:glycogen synthase, partial [Citrobacter sp. AAK_AS5]